MAPPRVGSPAVALAQPVSYGREKKRATKRPIGHGSALPARRLRPQNLDVPQLSPYTSAAPFKDNGFFTPGPPRLKNAGQRVVGMEEDFAGCHAAAN
jgi:hypothetical protein